MLSISVIFIYFVKAVGGHDGMLKFILRYHILEADLRKSEP